MVKKGKGRQKISMKKIDKDSNLHVTFSKRRAGLFKKASELCILCDANVGLIIFSPGNKVHSFGHPSVHTVIDKYVTNTDVHSIFSGIRTSSNKNQTSQRVIIELNDVEENTSIQKARRKQLDDLKKACEDHYWWGGPNQDKLTLEQLDMLTAMLEELQTDVKMKIQNLNLESNNYVGGPVINATSFVGSYDGMRYAYTQDRASFDPIMTAQTNGLVIPHEYRLDNEFANAPIIPSHPSVNDGVDPSGTNIHYGSANDFNKGYH